MKDVARLYGTRVVSAADLVSVDRLAELERIQAFAFSACTFVVDGTAIIVFSPFKLRQRKQLSTTSPGNDRLGRPFRGGP